MSGAHASFLAAVQGGVAGLIEDHLVTSRLWADAREERLREDVYFGHRVSFFSPGVWHWSMRSGALPLRIWKVVTLVM